MSSIYEPLGQTILEGLASGLPILAFQPGTDIETATAEQIGTEQGMFSAEPTVEGLYRVFQSAASLPDKEYKWFSENSRNHALENFSWDTLAMRLHSEVEK